MAREVTTSRSRSCASTCTWLFPRSFCVPTRNNVSSVPPTAATQRAASVSNTAELIAECAGFPIEREEDLAGTNSTLVTIAAFPVPRIDRSRLVDRHHVSSPGRRPHHTVRGDGRGSHAEVAPPRLRRVAVVLRLPRARSRAMVAEDAVARGPSRRGAGRHRERQERRRRPEPLPRARAGSPARRRGGRSTPTSGSGGSSSWSARAARRSRLSSPAPASPPRRRSTRSSITIVSVTSRVSTPARVSPTPAGSPRSLPREVDALRREVARPRARLDATAAQLADERRARCVHPANSTTPRLAEEPTRAALAAARAEAAAANARADKLQRALSERRWRRLRGADALVECGGGSVGGGGAERASRGRSVRGRRAGAATRPSRQMDIDRRRRHEPFSPTLPRSPRPSPVRWRRSARRLVVRLGINDKRQSPTFFAVATPRNRIVFVLYCPSSIFRAMS